MTFASAIRELARAPGSPEGSLVFWAARLLPFGQRWRDKNAEGRPEIDATLVPARFPEGDTGGWREPQDQATW